MSSFSEQALQEKLARLTSSQESIETLSMWIIHHRGNAPAIADVWIQHFVQANTEKRLLLFYLVNDVLQNGRRKSASVFLDVFQDPLRHASTLIKGLKVKMSVERIFHIWKERRIYDNAFLKELEDLIEPQTSNRTDGKQEKVDFKLSLLEDCLTELNKFQGEMKAKSTSLSHIKIDVSSTESLSKLKDKSSGGKFKHEFQKAATKLQEYVECTQIEVNERKNLLEMLEDSRSYHKQNLNEIQKLLKDYTQLQMHFVNLRDKLTEKIEELDKAQHTATSDPTSKKDITVAGDMELDSDTESQDEAPPMKSHPLSAQFVPRPIPVPPPLPIGITFPGNLPSQAPPMLPPRPPLFPPPTNIPYSPSMPQPFTPLSATSRLPLFPNKSPMTPSNVPGKSPASAPPKNFPESFFHDYSDSDSEVDDGDKPYSPSHQLVLSPIESNEAPPDEQVTPIARDEDDFKYYRQRSNDSAQEQFNNDTTGDASGTVVHTSGSHKGTSAAVSMIKPEDIKITPTLTNILGQIFPQLSKSLEERKRKVESEGVASNDSANKHAKISDNEIKTEAEPTSSAPPVVGGQTDLPSSFVDKPHPFSPPPTQFTSLYPLPPRPQQTMLHPLPPFRLPPLPPPHSFTPPPRHVPLPYYPPNNQFQSTATPSLRPRPY